MTMNRLSSKLERFRTVGLAHLPTPLEPLPQLTAYCGGPRLWVKREDCTGLGFGGNKIRKLDYVLREAISSGADTLVSGGVVQSNSQRQVSAAAAKLGMKCHLAVFHGRTEDEGEAYANSGNMLLNRLFGATIHDVPWTGERNLAIKDLEIQLRDQGRKPYLVPYGVSSPLGAIGYASTIEEISHQSEALGFTPSAIIHCSGSGGTQAGLVIGASLCLEKTRIIGIDIDAEPERVRADVIRFAEAAARLLGVPFSEEWVAVIAGHAGPAYGVPHDETIEAVKLAGRLEALILDPVYSGKGMAALLSMVRDGRWGAEDHVVFIHTGGTPSVFAYRNSLKA